MDKKYTLPIRILVGQPISDEQISELFELQSVYEMLEQMAATERKLGLERRIDDSLNPREQRGYHHLTLSKAAPLLRRHVVTTGGPIPPRPRSREHRPAGSRRAGASSRTSSADPGDDGEPGEGPGGPHLGEDHLHLLVGGSAR